VGHSPCVQEGARNAVAIGHIEMYSRIREGISHAAGRGAASAARR